MLCNECAANLRDGSWEVLMSSFVLGRIQDCDDLRRMVRVPYRSKALHQRSSVFHKLNRSVNVRHRLSNKTPSQPMNPQKPTNCFA